MAKPTNVQSGSRWVGKGRGQWARVSAFATETVLPKRPRPPAVARAIIITRNWRWVELKASPSYSVSEPRFT